MPEMRDTGAIGAAIAGMLLFDEAAALNPILPIGRDRPGWCCLNEPARACAPWVVSWSVACKAVARIVSSRWLLSRTSSTLASVLASPRSFCFRTRWGTARRRGAARLDVRALLLDAYCSHRGVTTASRQKQRRDRRRGRDRVAGEAAARGERLGAAGCRTKEEWARVPRKPLLPPESDSEVRGPAVSRGACSPREREQARASRDRFFRSQS
jgi:hypothetical protein